MELEIATSFNTVLNKVRDLKTDAAKPLRSPKRESPGKAPASPSSSDARMKRMEKMERRLTWVLENGVEQDRVRWRHGRVVRVGSHTRAVVGVELPGCGRAHAGGLQDAREARARAADRGAGRSRRRARQGADRIGALPIGDSLDCGPKIADSRRKTQSSGRISGTHGAGTARTPREAARVTSRRRKGRRAS